MRRDESKSDLVHFAQLLDLLKKFIKRVGGCKHAMTFEVSDVLPEVFSGISTRLYPLLVFSQWWR